MISEQFSGQDISTLKKDRSALELVLKQAGCTHIVGNAVRCPFCDDKRPSAGIYDGKGDGWRYKCHNASCGRTGSVIDVLAWADNIDPKDVCRIVQSTPVKQEKIYPDFESLKSAMPCEVEAVYRYTNPDTKQDEMLVFRCQTPEGKTFRQARPVTGGYSMKAPEKPWPIYNRTRVSAARTVVVVEGEKCVHSLHPYGIVATTSPGGAGKAKYADWSLLAGKNVILWPDNDTPGLKHMQDVQGILQTLKPEPTLTVLEPDLLDLTEKEDVCDFIQQTIVAGLDVRKELSRVLREARPKGMSENILAFIEDTISGKRSAVAMVWHNLSNLTKAMMTGTVTLLCGSGGASKSLMVMQQMIGWHDAGIPFACFELEDDTEYHVMRALAQRSETSGMTDPDWITKQPDEARRIREEHSDFLDSFGKCIFSSPESQPTYNDIAEWVDARFKDGCRIVIVDPITAVQHVDRDPWNEDNRFLQRVKRSAVEHKGSVLMVTHPVKNVSMPDQGQLAGSAAFARFCQCIIWLENHTDKKSTVKSCMGPMEVEHDRTVHILKARNGMGSNKKLAFQFDNHNLTLVELGVF